MLASRVVSSLACLALGTAALLAPLARAEDPAKPEAAPVPKPATGFSPKYRSGRAFVPPKAVPVPAPGTAAARPAPQAPSPVFGKPTAGGMTTVAPAPAPTQPAPSQTKPMQAIPAQPPKAIAVRPPSAPVVAPSPAPSTLAPAPTPEAPAPAAAEPTAEPNSPEPTPAESPTPTAAPKASAAGQSPRAIPDRPSALPKASGKAADFHKQYKEFFADNAFTDDLAQYWRDALTSEPERRAEVIQESAAFAAEALAAALVKEPADIASAGNALDWLNELYGNVDETTWTSVGDALGAAFADGPADVNRWLSGEAEATAARMAMQICLTFALYGDQSQLTRWLSLPDRTRSFLSDTQTFLFGGNALAEEQYASLASLFKAVPREVHRVLAVLVPEGIRMEAADAALATPGLVLNIYASPSGLSTPDEFYAELGVQPVAPMFTLEAATQLVRAAQYVQFALRPELEQRRNLILRNAGGEPTRYLRRAYPPAAYQSSPEELLPQTAWLWFIDSATAFQQAGGLLRFKESEAMDAVLLLADVLSGGGNTTLTFRTGTDGNVARSEVPLERMEVLPGVPFATGIAVAGQLWSFGIAPDGGVTREIAPIGVESEPQP